MDDTALTEGLEALRRRGWVKVKPGRIRPASSRPAVAKENVPGPLSSPRRHAAAYCVGDVQAKPLVMHKLTSGTSPEVLRSMAVDSVQTGLIASLERDCQDYRAQICKLQAAIPAASASQRDQNSSRSQRENALAATVDHLKAELAASHRERDALTATVSRLSREKNTQLTLLAQLEEQLAKERASNQARSSVRDQ